MKKYLILVFIAVAQMGFAQEARMFTIKVDPLEIEGYGTVEATIQQIRDNGHSPHMADPDRPIQIRERVKSDLEWVYTDSASREHRSFSCSKDYVGRLISALNNFQIIITNPDSMDLQKKGIEKKTLTPPIMLDDDGVKSTYTEEYYYIGYEWPTFGIYTNCQGQVVWYYQFGEANTQEQRMMWKVLVNDCKPMLEWLETIYKAM